MTTRYKLPAYRIIDIRKFKVSEPCYFHKDKLTNTCVEVARGKSNHGVCWSVCEECEENILDLVEEEDEAAEYDQKEKEWKENR